MSQHEGVVGRSGVRVVAVGDLVVDERRGRDRQQSVRLYQQDVQVQKCKVRRTATD